MANKSFYPSIQRQNTQEFVTRKIFEPRGGFGKFFEFLYIISYAFQPLYS